jgi:serine/threonine-protein kinase
MDRSLSWKGKILKKRYRLDDRIAVGRTVEVFRGYDILEEKEVAIKLPLPHLASDDEFNDNFRSAAHRATRLSNPGLVEVLDYGLEEGRPFVVVEMVHERTLHDMLKTKQKMKPLGALYFALEMGRILVYLHGQGVTHGSIDERHIFIFPGRKAKVSDPGFPSVLGGGARPYPVSMDPRQDIQDIGYLLYRCITGRSNDEVAEDVKTGELKWDPSVPARVQRLVLLCLESSGRGGFASAEQMLNETISTLREEQPMAAVPQPEAVAEETAEMEEAPTIALPHLKRWQIWVGASVIAVAAILLVFWMLSSFIGSSKVEVPNLVDISEEEALKVAGDRGLGIKVVGEMHDADIKATYIISQEPKGGVMVEEDTVIAVVRSLGPLTVPNLVGLSLEDAQTVLESRGFKVGEVIYRELPEYRENTVVETDPSYGSKLSSGDSVNLVVAKASTEN